ncbi:MAG: AMP-binding protein [Ignavibacteriaceae bacterium]|nr:AMP-binding protein [Ignavibacteriaceae bacterium]
MSTMNLFGNLLSQNLENHHDIPLLTLRKKEFEESVLCEIFSNKHGIDFITITYGEFFRAAEFISGFLPQEDNFVNISLKNRADFFIFASALIISGKTAVLIPPDATDLNAYRISGAEKTIDRAGINSFMSSVRASGKMLKNDYDIAPLKNRLLKIDDSAGIAVIFTSGSTSGPKAVPLSGFNFYSSFINTRNLFPYVAGEKWYLSLPPYHVGGFSVFMRALLSGMEVVAGETNPEKEDFYKELEITGSNYVSLVPTQIQRICRNKIKAPSSMKYVLTGGAPAGNDLIAKSLELGWPLYIVYGMTETAAFFAGGKVTGEEEPGFAGRPLGACTVTFTDEQGAASDRGIITVKTGAVTSGYISGEDAFNSRFSDGSFVTSDTGYSDPDGNLFISGRTDNIIITGGKKVNPAEVEEVLKKLLPGVQSAVIGIKDEEWGERVTAFIESDLSDPTDLFLRLKNLLEGYKIPREIVYLEEFPLTGPGKIDRQTLRKNYQNLKRSV